MRSDPDSPLPACSLITGFGYLVKLSAIYPLIYLHVALVIMTIRLLCRAKADVQKFAKDVIRDVQTVFRSRESGTFMQKKSLTKMRYVRILQRTNETFVDSTILSALVDEICKWATARLVCLNPRVFLRKHPQMRI